MFRVIVTEIVQHPQTDTAQVERQVYEQTVETLDLKRVIEAVNYQKRIRNRKQAVKDGELL